MNLTTVDEHDRETFTLCHIMQSNSVTQLGIMVSELVHPVNFTEMKKKHKDGKGEAPSFLVRTLQCHEEKSALCESKKTMARVSLGVLPMMRVGLSFFLTFKAAVHQW